MRFAMRFFEIGRTHLELRELQVRKECQHENNGNQIEDKAIAFGRTWRFRRRAVVGRRR